MPKYEEKKVQGRNFQALTSSIIVHEMKHLDEISTEEIFRDGNILSKFSASTGYSNLLEAMPTSEEDLETHKRFIDSLLDH